MSHNNYYNHLHNETRGTLLEIFFSLSYNVRFTA